MQKPIKRSPLPAGSAIHIAMQERIIKLETLAAMQDETIEKLNGELFRQQQDVARLQRRIDALEEKIADLDPSGEIAGNERPPHY